MEVLRYLDESVTEAVIAMNTTQSSSGSGSSNPFADWLNGTESSLDVGASNDDEPLDYNAMSTMLAYMRQLASLCNILLLQATDGRQYGTGRSHPSHRPRAMATRTTRAGTAGTKSGKTKRITQTVYDKQGIMNYCCFCS
jgi:hypothetical protein